MSPFDGSPQAAHVDAGLTRARGARKIRRTMGRPNRREFVKQVTVVGFGSYLAVAVGACRRPNAQGTDDAAPSPRPSGGAPVSFTPDKFATLTAACERILPRDEDPGAIDLGVPGYIDHAVADPGIAPWRDVLDKLLPVLDRQSKKRYGGKLFHEAQPGEQDALLASWQTGAQGERFFFTVLLALVFEGAFGDPKYGGNRGGQGFAMIGFTPGPPMPKMKHGLPTVP